MSEYFKKREDVYYRTLVKASCDFLDENFLGAVAYEYGTIPHGVTTISIKAYTGFIRAIFDFVFGKSLINVNFHVKSENLEITLSWNGHLLGDAELRELASISRESGFKFEFQKFPDGEALTLVLEKSRNKEFSVYAKDSVALKYTFIESFKNFKKN